MQKIMAVTRHDEAGAAAAHRQKGSVMTVVFELDGQSFVALNGGPMSTFTEAVSFVVDCETQDEIDRYWEQLSEGGDEKAQQCGWLKDKYGLSWQIVPRVLGELLNGSDPKKSQRVMTAMPKMKKIDLAVLLQAFGVPGTT